MNYTLLGQYATPSGPSHCAPQSGPPGVVPAPIAVAMGLVSMTNDFMEARCTASGEHGPGECELVEIDVPASQAAAFTCACNFLGVYFDTERERLEEQRLIEAGKSAGAVREAESQLGLESKGDHGQSAPE